MWTKLQGRRAEPLQYLESRRAAAMQVRRKKGQGGGVGGADELTVGGDRYQILSGACERTPGEARRCGDAVQLFSWL